MLLPRRGFSGTSRAASAFRVGWGRRSWSRSASACSRERAGRKTRAMTEELLKTLEDTSICGLGMSAAKPLVTAYQSFEGDLAEISSLG